MDTSKISSSVKLTVFMKVDVEVNTDKGIVREELSSSMLIPLNANYFEISGNLINEKPGSIQEIIQIKLPVDTKKIVLYSVIIGLLFLFLIFLSFFTKASERKSPLQRKLKQIFKKHGDRLVALNTEVTVTPGDYSEVKSIEDLVRIADELGKPIMYQYSSNVEEISKFYVFDETKIFLLNIHKGLEKSVLNYEGTKKVIKNHEAELKDAAFLNHDLLREDKIEESDNL